MLLISYDISDDKLRTKFSKFIKKYGRSLQYSVYEIKNSPRVLRIIMTEIEEKFEEKFQLSDSVLIFPICEACDKKIKRYGYAANEEQDVVYFR